MYSFDIFKAIFLGIIEGLTEFIPVSSTAHLVLFSQFINFNSIQNNLFEVIIQAGAILAICFIYRRKLSLVITDYKNPKQQKFVTNIFLAFLPAAIIGLIIHAFIKQYLFSNVTIAIALIVGGIIMIIVEKKDIKNKVNDIDNISYSTAIKIGFFQCIAMIPGVSRSGATIIGGLILGLNRKVATEFSFFLAIPTIFSASFYDLYKNISSLDMNNIELIAIGMISSFLSSLIVIKWFIGFVSKNKFTPFAIYRIILGISIIFIIL